jgi:hypothetical protein
MAGWTNLEESLCRLLPSVGVGGLRPGVRGIGEAKRDQLLEEVRWAEVRADGFGLTPRRLADIVVQRLSARRPVDSASGGQSIFNDLPNEEASGRVG